MNSSSQAMGTPKTTTKKKNQNLESKFHFDLNLCSKNKDLRSAVSLYKTAVAQSTRFNHHHCNSLLYLCSSSVADPSLKELALEYGFCVFRHMLSIGIAPNEATITAVARLAAAKGDGDYAFELVKSMGKYSAVPRLRTYDPALYCFCENLKAEKAYEVEKHMALVGVIPEEDEIAALLKVSSENGMEHRVYGYLHKLRNSVRCVGESTGKIIGDWFLGRRASEVGELNLEVGQIKEAVLRNGGGWHGLGWIGKGDWVVRRTSVDSGGECCSCTENLVCVDIDNAETERFAQSVASLAMERQVKSNFGEFQHWLEEHDDYEIIVDGANIGLYQQNFSDGGFSVSQLEAVVRELYSKSGKKWPLVVLHNKRFHALAENPLHRKLFEEWMRKGVLYTTPNGSNDDWYWLYAAVKLKCLLVTNDEMRDHIFELLGTSLFLKWKERHQVRYTFVKGNLKLQMPPPYSSAVQESEKGTWHIPLAGDCSSEESGRRSWLCITRPSVTKALDEVSHSTLTSQNGDGLHRANNGLLHLCTAKTVAGNDSSQIYDNDTTTVTGKRKERSLSGSSP